MTAFVKRRELLLGLAALPVASRIAVAEAYPSRPVRILVATSAGGGTDLVARFIAQWLTERLGQSFFVENRPGGGNNIGTEMAARSPADGYTLFMANTVNTINNSLYQKLNYNFIADFAPVANVMGTPLLVLVHPSVRGKKCRRTDRARQGQPRQAQPRLGRRRLDRSHVRRAVPDDGRHQVHPCAVSRRGARAHRSDRRPGAADGFDHRLVAAVRQGRHSARARDDDRRPCGRTARCAAAVEDGAGLSGQRLERPLCAERNACRRSSPCSTRR